MGAASISFPLVPHIAGLQTIRRENHACRSGGFECQFKPLSPTKSLVSCCVYVAWSPRQKTGTIENAWKFLQHDAAWDRRFGGIKNRLNI